MNQHVITSPDKESTIVIDQGELISYSKFGEELIHQKGDPGWRNADTEMFPIIGPTEDNDFMVETERGDAVQDQHGLLRELAYSVVNETDHSIVYSKTYTKNTLVKNSKYPDKSTKKMVSWPYSFMFSKKFSVTDDALKIEDAFRKIDSVLKIFDFQDEYSDSKIEQLVAQREKARSEKNWKLADKLRDKLKSMGILVQDQKLKK